MYVKGFVQADEGFSAFPEMILDIDDLVKSQEFPPP
jgi:hypothetical protein